MLRAQLRGTRCYAAWGAPRTGRLFLLGSALALFGRGIEMIIATRPSGATATDDGGPTEIAEWGFDTPSRFHARLEQKSRASMTLVLERQGTSWQVIAIEPSDLGGELTCPRTRQRRSDPGSPCPRRAPDNRGGSSCCAPSFRGRAGSASARASASPQPGRRPRR